MSPVSELFLTVTPDAAVPWRDEEAPGQDGTAQQVMNRENNLSPIQKRSRLVIEDARMFVFAVLVFWGWFA
jgi:hypothetical protein